jgi:hypothetical protein
MHDLKNGGGGVFAYKDGALCGDVLKFEDCEWESSYVQGQLLFGWL